MLIISHSIMLTTLDMSLQKSCTWVRDLAYLRFSTLGCIPYIPRVPVYNKTTSFDKCRIKQKCQDLSCRCVASLQEGSRNELLFFTLSTACVLLLCSPHPIRHTPPGTGIVSVVPIIHWWRWILVPNAHHISLYDAYNTRHEFTKIMHLSSRLSLLTV